MKNCLVLLTFLLTGFHAWSQDTLDVPGLKLDYAHPRDYVIGGVTVSGTRFLDQHVLINLSGLVIGDTIEVPGDVVSDAIKNLWKQGLFADVRIVATKVLGDKIFFDIQLSERPRMSGYTFEGDVSKSEAEKIREQTNLGFDRVITDNLITTSTNAIKKFYAEKGNFDHRRVRRNWPCPG